MSEERSQASAFAEAKFATQRGITYLLILIFACVVAEVLWRDVETERSTVLQTVINLTMLAVGYWLGASKAGQDTQEAVSMIAARAPEAQAAAVAAARAEPLPPVPPGTPGTPGDPLSVRLESGPGTQEGEPLKTQEQPK